MWSFLMPFVLPTLLNVTQDIHHHLIRTQALNGDLQDVQPHEVKCALDQCGLGVWESILEDSSRSYGSIRRKLTKRNLSAISLDKCRHSIATAYNCLKAALEGILEGKSKCHCEQDAIGWAVGTVEAGMEAALNEYCYPNERCADPRANECVGTVIYAFGSLSHLEASAITNRSQVFVNFGDLLMKMEQSEKCIGDIRKGDVLLHGCENNAYLKDAELLYMLTAARATLMGCNVKAVSTSCGLSKVLEGTAEFCSLTPQKKRHETVKIMACSTTEFLKLGHYCAEVIHNLLICSGALLKSTEESCSLQKKIAAHVAACQGNPSIPDNKPVDDASGTNLSQPEVSADSHDMHGESQVDSLEDSQINTLEDSQVDSHENSPVNSHGDSQADSHEDSRVDSSSSSRRIYSQKVFQRKFEHEEAEKRLQSKIKKDNEDDVESFLFSNDFQKRVRYNKRDYRDYGAYGWLCFRHGSDYHYPVM